MCIEVSTIYKTARALKRGVDRKKGKQIWNIWNIIDRYISFQLFLESFPTDFPLLWIVNTSALRRCKKGWWLFFSPPFLLQCITKAKFSSSGGAFVSFEEFIFFFSSHSMQSLLPFNVDPFPSKWWSVEFLLVFLQRI